jgi:hypothetical protein
MLVEEGHRQGRVREEKLVIRAEFPRPADKRKVSIGRDGTSGVSRVTRAAPSPRLTLLAPVARDHVDGAARPPRGESGATRVTRAEVRIADRGAERGATERPFALFASARARIARVQLRGGDEDRREARRKGAVEPPPREKTRARGVDCGSKALLMMVFSRAGCSVAVNVPRVDPTLHAALLVVVRHAADSSAARPSPRRRRTGSPRDRASAPRS